MLHHLDTTKKDFIGRTLKSIQRTGPDSAIIEFMDCSVEIKVIGDCCSESIFYEIEMPENLVGATLLDIIENGWDLASLAHTTADDEETALRKIRASGIPFSPEDNKIWNVVLVTDKGNALLRHINSSNGYYDGYTEYKTIL